MRKNFTNQEHYEYEIRAKAFRPVLKWNLKLFFIRKIVDWIYIDNKLALNSHTKHCFNDYSELILLILHFNLFTCFKMYENIPLFVLYT